MYYQHSNVNQRVFLGYYWGPKTNFKEKKSFYGITTRVFEVKKDFHTFLSCHKIISAILPTYLFNLIPKSMHGYQRRTSGNIPMYQCRTDISKLLLCLWYQGSTMTTKSLFWRTWSTWANTKRYISCVTPFLASDFPNKYS